MSGWTSATATLASLLSSVVRGPKREGAYAVWLVVRVAHDLTLTPPLGERARRRRLDALAHRLSSLTVTPPLRRALAGALATLAEGTAAAATVALHHLVAPVREGLGTDPAEAVAQAARAARATTRA
ncbi:MAG: hypothetical protein ACREL4_08105 [Gemmatimonadales bacterium]